MQKHEEFVLLLICSDNSGLEKKTAEGLDMPTTHHTKLVGIILDLHLWTSGRRQAVRWQELALNVRLH